MPGLDFLFGPQTVQAKPRISPLEPIVPTFLPKDENSGGLLPPEETVSKVQEATDQSGKINWTKLIASLAPTAIGAIAGGTKGAIAGTYLTSEFLKGSEQGKASRRRREQAQAEKDERKRTELRKGLIDSLKTVSTMEGFEAGVERLAEEGFTDDADFFRQELQGLKKKAADKKAKEEAERADRIDHEVTRTIVENARRRVDDQEKATAAERESAESELNRLISLKQFQDAAPVARKLGQESLASSLEKMEAGTNTGLADVVMQNPDMLATLTPTARTDILPELLRRGFDFKSVTTRDNDPQAKKNGLMRRADLVDSFSKTLMKRKNMDPREAINEAEATVARLLGEEPKTLTTDRSVQRAVEVLKGKSKAEAEEALKGSKTLTPAQKEEVRKALGLDQTTALPFLPAAVDSGTAVSKKPQETDAPLEDLQKYEAIARSVLARGYITPGEETELDRIGSTVGIPDSVRADLPRLRTLPRRRG